MTTWEHLEEYIVANLQYGDFFTAREYSETTLIDIEEASANIQLYLDAQRRLGSRTVATLRREGRTSAAKWTVGDKTVDVVGIAETFKEDVAIKIRGAVLPDLRSILIHTPRLKRRIESQIDMFAAELMSAIRAEIDAWREDQEQAS